MVEYMSDQPSVHDMQLLFAKKRLYELQEAVRWERECEWVNDLITEQYVSVAEIAPEEEEISVSFFEARAAVDALIGDGVNNAS